MLSDTNLSKAIRGDSYKLPRSGCNCAGRRRRAGHVRRRHAGQSGMELSLFSRDVIANGRPACASHTGCSMAPCAWRMPTRSYRACSRALASGTCLRSSSCGSYEPAWPTGKEPASASCSPKAKPRRDALLQCEADSYHSAGTCTFYGRPNSNQMLMELMGLHMARQRVCQSQHGVA